MIFIWNFDEYLLHFGYVLGMFWLNSSPELRVKFWIDPLLLLTSRLDLDFWTSATKSKSTILFLVTFLLILGQNYMNIFKI